MDHNTAELLRDMLDEEVLIPAMLFVTVLVMFFIGTIGKVITRVSREKTKREVAAYIAEGTMSPEQGERLLRAGSRNV
ncbi:MAG: hypothetical protein AAGI17_03055 [Planctomycetota bacterium]